MSAVEALHSQSSTSAPSLAVRDAAHGLFERHHNKILGFCVRRLSTREEAEDAVQTVFVNALRALQRGVVPISEEAWLFKIAENVCRETHRSNGRRRLREVSEPEDFADPVARDGAAMSDTARGLISALDTLPENQRRALLLREWRGLSYKEIANDLRCTVGAVETLIFRARRNMAQALSQTKTRLAGLLDLGSLVGALKTVFGGATVAKVAAAAAVVTVVALPAGDAPQASSSKQVPVVPTSAKELPSEATTSASGIVAPHAVPGSRADKQPRRPGSGKPASSSRKVAPGAESQSAPTEETPATQSPGSSNTRETPLITPPSVQVPPPPVVELPQVPELPELPVQVPELPVQLPTELQVPELPVPPELPVQLPTEVQLPELP